MSQSHHAPVRAAALAITLAFAAPFAAAGEVPVSTAGLDMSTPEGRAALDHRLERAALRLCGRPSLRDAGSVRQVQARKACIADTIELAERTLERKRALAAHGEAEKNAATL